MDPRVGSTDTGNEPLQCRGKLCHLKAIFSAGGGTEAASNTITRVKNG